MANGEAQRIVPSVLLVDDRPENLLALEGVLKPLGAKLVKARSGEDALLHLLRETFAVILLDVQMPRLDGLQTAELIKRGEQIRRRAFENEAKDVFLVDVVHELKTPLAAAKAQAQLALHQLGERSADAGTARALRLISQQIDRLNRLVGDRDRIEQVLANLLSNAIRYSPEGGAIQLRAEQKGNEVRVIIKDHGLGIPQGQQQLVFERFGRAHGTAFGGLGLGLAISKGIVDAHGGRIWVESDGVPGKGSVFHLELPLHPPVNGP